MKKNSIIVPIFVVFTILSMVAVISVFQPPLVSKEVPCFIDDKPCIQRKECKYCTECEKVDKCCCMHVDRCTCVPPTSLKGCCP